MFQEPGPDCSECPRLATFRADNRRAHPEWFNAPVPAFGPLSARLLIVGLAPGLKGANLTGRPFTGDYAGDLLYETLLAHGFAEGTYGKTKDDGLNLMDCRITNAVRCVPPENKPTGLETRTCNRYLSDEIADMADLEAVLALGTLSHGAVLRAAGLPLKTAKFVHGARHDLGNGESRRPILFDSYHCSRYNTNTRRLTPEMFTQVFGEIRQFLG